MQALDGTAWNLASDISRISDRRTSSKRNRGAAGIDRVSIAMFQKNLVPNLDKLMRQLKSGTFRPLPARRVYIPKAPGKFRPPGIPAFRDRVAQEVLRQLLSPLFERLFHDHSYGFRPKRNCHLAIEKIRELHRQGFTHVLDADIAAFFDQLLHAAILTELALVVADGNILELVRRFLCAGVMESGKYQTTRIGTPQGGVISPLLAMVSVQRHVPHSRPMDTHATEMHENQTQIGSGQSPTASGTPQTYGAPHSVLIPDATCRQNPRLSLMGAIPAGAPGAGKMHAGK